MEAKIMTVKQALKKEANGNPAILNSLMYSSYAANRDNGLSHSQLLSIGLGNTEMLLRYNTEKAIS